jgi:hypothetical protein
MIVCGPNESYRYVAKEFQCPRGGNPLAGDVERAQQVRLGTLQHPTNGHIVDIYRVPCPDGDVELFVDMYGCEEYAQRLNDTTPSKSLEDLLTGYDEEDYEAVITRCARAPDELEPDELLYCMVLVPASLFVVGSPDAAVQVLQQLCSRLPPPSSLSDARAQLVVRVTGAVARTAERRGIPLGIDDGTQLVAVFAEACELTRHDFDRWLTRHEMI